MLWVLTGLMAAEMGGRRYATAVSLYLRLPFCIGGGALMQYVSFDYLCWVSAAYFVVIVADRRPRWWLAIGTAIASACSRSTYGLFQRSAFRAVVSPMLADS